jgi:hypothetical protein
LWVQKLSTFHSKPFQNLNCWNIWWMMMIRVMKYCIQASGVCQWLMMKLLSTIYDLLWKMDGYFKNTNYSFCYLDYKWILHICIETKLWLKVLVFWSISDLVYVGALGCMMFKPRWCGRINGLIHMVCTFSSRWCVI